MRTQQTYPTATFEQVWAAFQETGESIKEKEINRLQLKYFFDNKIDDFINTIINLKLFQEKGIKVRETMRRVEIEGLAEYDILMVNGIEMVVVEVKTTMKNDDVKYFLEK